MLQMSYDTDLGTGVAGQIATNEPHTIRSLPAAEYIPFGVLLQLDSTGKKVQVVQNTGAGLGTPLGVSCYVAAREQAYQTLGSAGYAAGDMVPYLVRGTILACWSGTTQSPETKPNVYHSSTLTATRGFFTDAGTSTSAGVEVANAPNGTVFGSVTADTGLCKIRVNYPAA